MTTILIVDGDKEFVGILSRGLRRQRYLVLTANNRRDAIAHLEAEPVDVAFLDVMMAHREGLETVHEIKQRFPRTPVFTMSGGSIRENFEFMVQAMEFGATAGLRKPIDSSQVIAIVRSLPPRR